MPPIWPHAQPGASAPKPSSQRLGYSRPATATDTSNPEPQGWRASPSQEYDKQMSVMIGGPQRMRLAFLVTRWAFFAFGRTILSCSVFSARSAEKLNTQDWQVPCCRRQIRHQIQATT